MRIYTLLKAIFNPSLITPTPIVIQNCTMAPCCP
jgi:hypothetical protein